MEDIFRKHQLKIARDTMKLSCIGASILGGMDHIKAAELLHKSIDNDCTCKSEKNAWEDDYNGKQIFA